MGTFELSSLPKQEIYNKRSSRFLSSFRGDELGFKKTKINNSARNSINLIKTQVSNNTGIVFYNHIDINSTSDIVRLQKYLLTRGEHLILNGKKSDKLLLITKKYFTFIKGEREGVYILNTKQQAIDPKILFQMLKEKGSQLLSFFQSPSPNKDNTPPISIKKSNEHRNILQEKSEKINKISQVGDIIFQTSQSGQSTAIQHATNSNISHVGMIVEHNGLLQVIEAVQPVKITNLTQWISQGKGTNISLKRVPFLTDKQKDFLYTVAKNDLGKQYDLLFGWDDDKIYCSELVYKAYSDIGLNIGELETMGDLNFAHKSVISIFIKRLKLHNIPSRYKKILLAGIMQYKTPNKLLLSNDNKYLEVIEYINNNKKIMSILQSILITPKSIYNSNKLNEIYTDY